MRVTLIIGNRLKKGVASNSGLYAVISERKGITLRVSTHKNVAEYFTECSSRYLAECWITGKMNEIPLEF